MVRRQIVGGPLVLVTTVVVLFGGCGRETPTPPGSPVVPTPTPTPPPQGFVLRGNVYDTALRPLDQARIEAMDGPQAGAITVSNAQGQYSFSQRFTEGLTLRASKDGYVTAQQSVISQGSSLLFASFTLGSPTPSMDLVGNYAVTLTADAACTALPPNTVSRSYTATISRSVFRDTHYIGRLGGAAFAPGPYVPYDTLFASVFGSFVNFSFWNLENDEANGVVEQVGPETYVGIRGEAGATFEGASIDIPFSGSFVYCTGARASSSVFVCPTAPITCDSKNHRLTVRRSP